jgi:hypothetical protein
LRRIQRIWPLCMLDRKSRDRKRPWPKMWSKVIPLGARIRNRKLRNIRPSGAFSLEVTPSNVTRRASPGTGSWGCGKGVRIRNWKLCNIHPSGHFHRKCPFGCSLGGPRLSFSRPGYLALPRHFIFI